MGTHTGHWLRRIFRRSFNLQVGLTTHLPRSGVQRMFKGQKGKVVFMKCYPIIHNYSRFYARVTSLSLAVGQNGHFYGLWRRHFPVSVEIWSKSFNASYGNSLPRKNLNTVLLKHQGTISKVQVYSDKIAGCNCSAWSHEMSWCSETTGRKNSHMVIQEKAVRSMSLF